MRRTALLAFFAMFASAPVNATAVRVKIAVLDMQTTGIDPQYVGILTEVLTAEIDLLDRYQVIAGRDVEAMLGFEKEKDMVGCTDAACLAEIGGALGVEKIVVGHAGKLGSQFVVNIKLIDIRAAVTEGRIYETVQGEIGLLVNTIKTSVAKLFEKKENAATEARANKDKVEIYPKSEGKDQRGHAATQPDPTVGEQAEAGSKADKKIGWIWIGAGAAMAGGGVVLDTVPGSAKNGTYDALDFMPLVLYLGAAAVVTMGIL